MEKRVLMPRVRLPLQPCLLSCHHEQAAELWQTGRSRASHIHGYPQINNVWISMVYPWILLHVSMYNIHGYPIISVF